MRHEYIARREDSLLLIIDLQEVMLKAILASEAVLGKTEQLIHSLHKKQVVVAGTEAHVCVLQTCLDMIQAGFQVHLAADAVASRRVENRDTAISQLRQAGAVISSAEIVIFEWAERANTEEFRKVLPIVR